MKEKRSGDRRGNVDSKEFCDRKCERCWVQISKLTAIFGIFFWIADVFAIWYMVQNHGAFQFRAWILPLAVLVCRIYWCTGRLVKFYFAEKPLLLRIALAAFFTLIPSLDVLFLLHGPKEKVFVRDFLIDEDPDVFDELVSVLRNRYLLKVLGEKEFLIYAQSAFKVTLYQNVIFINEDQITCCIFDKPADLANRVISYIENAR